MKTQCTTLVLIFNLFAEEEEGEEGSDEEDEDSDDSDVVYESTPEPPTPDPWENFPFVDVKEMKESFKLEQS